MDVLIIDDEKAVRDSTLLALEMEDHYAEAVSSGMVGIQRLKEEVFDLVFLDLNLGSENGETLHSRSTTWSRRSGKTMATIAGKNRGAANGDFHPFASATF